MLNADKELLEAAERLAAKLRRAADAVVEAQCNYKELERICINTPGFCVQGGPPPPSLQPFSLTITFGVKL